MEELESLSQREVETLFCRCTVELLVVRYWQTNDERDEIEVSVASGIEMLLVGRDCVRIEGRTLQMPLGKDYLIEKSLRRAKHK